MKILKNLIVPKNVKGGILWAFLTSNLLQTIGNFEGGLWRHLKIFQKSQFQKNRKGLQFRPVLYGTENERGPFELT